MFTETSNPPLSAIDSLSPEKRERIITANLSRKPRYVVLSLWDNFHNLLADIVDGVHVAIIREDRWKVCLSETLWSNPNLNNLWVLFETNRIRHIDAYHTLESQTSYCSAQDVFKLYTLEMTSGKIPEMLDSRSYMHLDYPVEFHEAKKLAMTSLSPVYEVLKISAQSISSVSDTLLGELSND